MKKIIFIIFSLFLLLLVVIGFFYFKNEEEKKITLTEARMLEGVILSSTNREISIETIKNSEMGEDIKEMFIFSFDNKTIFTEETGEVKEESDFRKEEKDYLSSLNSNLDKSIYEYRFAPSWYRIKEITKKDLSDGDKVRVVYYKDSEGLIATHVLVKFDNKVPISTDKEKEDKKNYNLNVSIVSVEENSLTVQGEGDIFSEGNLKVAINNNTLILERTVKSEVEFREEERLFKISKEQGKDNKEAPSWFKYEEINKDSLRRGDDIMLIIEKIEGGFVAKKIEKDKK